jgi:membrane peptidoglycan carboxypeptidase
MGNRLGIKTALDAVLSITLGAEEVRPEDMAIAYSTLANYGTLHDSYIIERITDADGEVIYEHKDESRSVLDEQIAAAVVGSMKKVISSGTGRRADIGRPAAGKTGTATRSTDVWFAGFVPQLTTAIWVGDPDGTIPLEDFTVFNDAEQTEQFYRTASGGTLAAPIWKQFMEYALAGLPVLDFAEEPPGTDLYRQTPFTRVPPADVATDAVVDDLYAVGLKGIIEQVPSALPQGTFIATVPAAGATLRQGSEVIVQVSSGEAPAIALVDLRGLAPDQVADRLAEFATQTGVTLKWTLLEVVTSNPSLHGIVVSTNPAAGSPVADGQTIQVRVGRAP